MAIDSAKSRYQACTAQTDDESLWRRWGQYGRLALRGPSRGAGAERRIVMSAIGEKQGEFTGTITSVTITETDAVVTFEEDTLGLVLGTATFGCAIDPRGETGPFTVHAKALLAEGGSCRCVGRERGGKQGHSSGRRRRSCSEMGESVSLSWMSSTWQRGPRRGCITRSTELPVVRGTRCNPHPRPVSLSLSTAYMAIDQIIVKP